MSSTASDPAIASERAGLMGPEDLEPVWLTTVLRGAGRITDASVSSATIAPLSPGSGLVGRLFRLSFQYDREAPGAPRSAIAKLPAVPGPMLDLALRFRMYEREANFYSQLASDVELPTPQLYGARARDDGGCTLLLEDLEEATAGDLLAGCSLSQIESLLPAIAAMHCGWWDSPKLDSLTWLPVPNDATALAVAAAVSGGAWQEFLRRYGEHLPPRLVEVGERLQRDRSVLDRLSARPRTLVHADLRINNFMFEDRERTRLRAVLDWQSTVQARGPMDIARLFVNNLEPADRRQAEAELLPRYHELLLAGGVRDYSYADCWEDYRLAVINQFGQVVVLSTLLDLDDQQGEEVGAATGTRLLVALLDLDLLELMPRPPLVSRALVRLRRLSGRS